jgi:predicted TIM-barrel fold metal-dependent hydrolase
VIIDAHCHVWPDALAPRVLATRPAGLTAIGDGTVADLERTMDAAEIDLACALAIANEANHVARTNEFIGSIDRSRFIPCGTVHTGLSVEENLRHLKENGILGVKFHPNFQGISLGDPAIHEIFMALAEAGIPVLAHVGHGSDASADERGATRHLLTIRRLAPTLKLVAFHFGGYHSLETAEQLVIGDSTLSIETSYPPRLGDLGRARVKRILEKQGPTGSVFGSDWPMADPATELAFIRSLGLSQAHESALLGENLSKIFDLQKEGAL